MCHIWLADIFLKSSFFVLYSLIMFSNDIYYNSLVADWSQLAAMAEFLSSEAWSPFPYASHIGLVGRLLSMEGESLGI